MIKMIYTRTHIGKILGQDNSFSCDLLTVHVEQEVGAKKKQQQTTAMNERLFINTMSM